MYGLDIAVYKLELMEPIITVKSNNKIVNDEVKLVDLKGKYGCFYSINEDIS